jgi:hypothetical protein
MKRSIEVAIFAVLPMLAAVSLVVFGVIEGLTRLGVIK